MLPLRRRLAVPLVAGLMVLTACGGDGDGDSNGGGDGNGSTSEPAERAEEQEPSESPAEDPSASAADQALVESALLTLQDFPVGWESAPPDDEAEDRAGREEIAQCVGVDYDDLYDDGNATADSPDFTSENDDEVSQNVSVASDEEDMAEAFEIGATPEFRECAADSLSEAVAESVEESGEDVTVGDISLNDLSIGALGDQTIAYRITIPVEAGGLDLEITIETAVVRVGRGRVNMSSSTVGSGLSTEEFAGFVQTAVQRLEGALAEG